MLIIYKHTHTHIPFLFEILYTELSEAELKLNSGFIHDNKYNNPTYIT